MGRFLSWASIVIKNEIGVDNPSFCSYMIKILGGL